MIEVQDRNRVAMSQRERDVLKAMQPVLDGKRTQAEAARILKLSVRQVRRIRSKLEDGGDTALVHGLRGEPSNHQHDPALRKKVLQAYRKKYSDFGPTFAREKLAEEGLKVGVETLRRWLLAAGLWQRRRTRDPHRSRRPRRSCFGELIQMDASIHDWLEGRGETIVLITMIDDATSRVLARFYPAGTVETHMDLLGRWVRKYGRPLALYTDRHSIFEPHEKGQPLADPDATTQFGRALAELDIDLIRAHSPQAKGRVERSFGTAQDRWVKELRLAKAKTCDQANAVLEKLLPAHNKKFAQPARQAKDAHRRLGPSHRLESILSIQTVRVVSNDYVVRLANRFYQLLGPVHPGERGGRVMIEERLDGSMAIRFGKHYLKYRELTAADSSGGSAPVPPEFGASTADASEKNTVRGTAKAPRTAGMQPTAGRSGRTPAEPYPPDGATVDSRKPAKRPAQNHPWRKPYK
jgi:Helix-turn-helix domain